MCELAQRPVCHGRPAKCWPRLWLLPEPVRQKVGVDRLGQRHRFSAGGVPAPHGLTELEGRREIAEALLETQDSTRSPGESTLVHGLLERSHADQARPGCASRPNGA